MAAVSASERNKNLRAEYAAANRYCQHLTEINWQLGSILIGGSLAAVALSLTAKHAGLAPIFIAAGAIVSISSWFLFLKRNRDFSKVANARMWWIEQELGLELLRRLQNYARGETNPWEYPMNKPSWPSGYANARILAAGLVLVLLLLISYLLLAWFVPATL